ncbi:MAG TPA: hypothetical protein VK509_00935 [Polyangiales bacterium]|nr:hypothetical protein [Polyangiales bacterium]
MDRDQLAYVPELFDIHVMAFADDSETAVRALQDIFRIEREDARRLIADAPVVVKRSAAPDVAEALLDALSALGAQVVLMPARQREPARVAAPAPAAAPPAPVPTAATPAPALSTGAGWGGLDLASEQIRARRPAPETWDQSGSIPAALAGGEDLDYPEPPRAQPEPPRAQPEPRRAQATSALLELDVPTTSGSTDRMRTVPASAERNRVRAPAAEMSLTSDRGVSLPPDASHLAPSLRPGADAFDHAPLSGSLAPASLRPKPSFAPPPPPAAPRAMPPPAPPAPPVPPTRKAAAPPPPPPTQVAAPPARKPGVPPPPPPPDLGLGTVPPLPLLAGAAGSEAPAPPRKTRSSPRPPPHGNPRFEHRVVDAGEAMKLPRIDVSTPLLRPSPSAEAAATANAGKTASTSAAADAVAKPTRSVGREPSTRIATQAAQAAQDGAAQPSSAEQVAPRPKAPPARGRALIEIAFGILVFYLGLHMDNTVLHGNASLTWTLLHTFGLYAIGSGIAGLWP